MYSLATNKQLKPDEQGILSQINLLVLTVTALQQQRLKFQKQIHVAIAYNVQPT